MNTIIPPSDGEIDEARRTIRRAVRLRQGERWRRASLLRRVLIWMEIEREVKAELNRRFGPHLLRGMTG